MPFFHVSRYKQLLSRAYQDEMLSLNRVGVFLLLGIILVSFAAYRQSVSAATFVAVPNSDVSSAWPACNASCPAAMTYSLVDEGSTANTGDWIGTGLTGGGGEVVEYGLTTTANIVSASQVQVCVNAQSATNAGGGTLDSLSINLRVDGALLTAVAVTPAFNTWADHCATFNGNWSQQQVDQMQAVVTRNMLGGGKPADQDDDVRISNIYASVTYVQGSIFSQSSYRWFGNQDVATTSTFAKVYGSTGADYNYSAAATKDGGYIATGATSSYGGGSNDMIISRYSATGALSWSRTWGGTGSDVGYGVTVSNDGGFVVTGLTASYGTNNEAFTNKYAADGTLLWSRTWGGAGIDAGFNVTPSTDGGAVITGRTSSFGGGGDDIFVAKYSTNGALQWSRTWGGVNGDIGRAIQSTPDGGFVVTGDTANEGTSDAVIIKYDANGTQEWVRLWQGSLTDVGWALDVANDGTIYIAGQTNSYGTRGNDMFLAKIDTAGSILWSRTWGDDGGGGGEEIANAVAIDQSGDIVVSGHTNSWSANGSNDIFMVKFDASGAGLWAKSWGENGIESNRSIFVDESNNYIIAGTTDGYGSGGNDMMLLKTSSDGNIDGCSAPMCKSLSMITTSPVASTTNVVITPPAFTPTTTIPSATVTSPSLTTTSLVATFTGVDVGAPLAAQDTAAAVAAGSVARLRTTLHVDNGLADPGLHQFKLQAAQRGGDGVCDTSFTGETFTDIGPDAGEIRFANSNLAEDGRPVVANANDPVHNAHSVALQSYEDYNNFFLTAPIAVGQDGLWDFALDVDNAVQGATYCFRVVKSDGTLLSSYTSLPELTIPTPTVSQTDYRFYDHSGVLDPGAPLAAQNSAATVAPEAPFRLRKLINQSSGWSQAGTGYKLQAGEKLTTCSAASFADITGLASNGSTGFRETASSFVQYQNPSSASDYGWSNGTNAGTNDGLYAHAEIPFDGVNAPTALLEASGYGFAIPTNATITGIEVQIEVANAIGASLNALQLTKGGIQPDGTTKSGNTLSGTMTFGSSSDLWGTTWTPAEINDPYFGVQFAADLQNVSKPVAASGMIDLDYMSVNIHYTLPDTGGAGIYAHVTGSLTDDSAITTTANDPTPASGATIAQTYNEDGIFSIVSPITVGDSALWDFSLVGGANATGKTFCLRTVSADGSPLASYATYPEITIGTAAPPTGPALNQQLRGGQSVIDGVKNPFSW